MKIGVAISNYKNDEQVFHLINRISKEEWDVEGIIVIDSLGDAKFIKDLDEKVSGKIIYKNYDYNLGSAGNLSKRLLLAREQKWDFVLALNHDALVTKSTLEALKKHTDIESLGALYPSKYYTDKGFYDFSGTKEVGPWRSFGPSIKPDEDLISHIWSSSNGALYSLKPIREGIIPREELWMGWEDYLFGLDLRQAGYKQYLVCDATCDDNYEFQEKDFGIFKIKLAAKPQWYHYYRTRNLWLIAFHYHRSFIRIFFVFIRTFAEAVLIAFGWERTNKFNALKLQFQGLIHGLLNQKGKKEIPQ